MADFSNAETVSLIDLVFLKNSSDSAWLNCYCFLIYRKLCPIKQEYYAGCAQRTKEDGCCRSRASARESGEPDSLFSVSNKQATVIGVAAQLVQKTGNILFTGDLGVIHGRIEDPVHIAAL